MRGVAVIMAVLFHGFPSVLTGGFIGVEIFFVVSGFLIGIILLQATADGSFTFSEFYARRIRRIFPALFVVLAACAIAGWHLLLTQEFQQLSKHILAGAGFVSNFAHWDEVNYFDTAAETKPLLHLWSLGVEEQFYIFLPPLLLLIARFRLRTKTLIALLWLLSFAGNLYITSIDRTQAFYSPLPRLWELLTGCMLAKLYLEPEHPLTRWVSARRNQQWLIECTAFTGIALILVPALLLHRSSYFPGPWTLPPVIGTALLITVGLHSWFNRTILANPVLVWVGQISYPLYLWHWPLLSIAHMLDGKVPPVEVRVLLVAVSVVLATLTWRYIERPARTGRWRTQAVPVLSVLMICAAAVGAYTWQVDTSGVRSFAQQEKFLKEQSLFNFLLDRQHELPGCGANELIVGRARDLHDLGSGG